MSDPIDPGHPAHSHTFERLPGYPLAEVPRIRRELRAAGVDVIDLGAGDADLPPPPQAVEALRLAALDPSFSRYPFQLGSVEFREEIAVWMKHRFDCAVDPMEEVLPLIGSKEGIAHLPLGYLDPGDRAVMPDPGYQAYRGGVTLASGDPVLVPLRAEDDFLVPLDRIPVGGERPTKILFLNYPNNPTTAVAPRDYLADVVAFCREHAILLAYDNAYSEIAFDGYRPPSILEIDGARDVSIEFHSLSKTYNMTGWRIGWAVGQPEAIRTLSRVKTFMDTGAFLGIQEAGRAALAAHAEWVPGNVERFRMRRDAAVEAFSEAGYDVVPPRATMYLWIPIPDGAASSDAFALRALKECGVVVLPGGALGDGGEGYFRIALTVEAERLREAAARLAAISTD